MILYYPYKGNEPFGGRYVWRSCQTRKEPRVGTSSSILPAKMWRLSMRLLYLFGIVEKPPGVIWHIAGCLQ